MTEGPAGGRSRILNWHGAVIGLTFVCTHTPAEHLGLNHNEATMGEKLGFSNGLIIGQVVGGDRDTPIANAIVGLQSVTNAGAYTQVQLFNSTDNPVYNLNDRTNRTGGFALFFRWDNTALGTLDMPKYRLKVSVPLDRRGNNYAESISREGIFAAVVSLRAVGEGRIPSFKWPNTAVNVLKDIKIVLKAYEWKFPNMFLAGASGSNLTLGALV
jgi:hypothetical protein